MPEPMKPVKAWAVRTKKGAIPVSLSGQLEVYKAKTVAEIGEVGPACPVVIVDCEEWERLKYKDDAEGPIEENPDDRNKQAI